MAGFGLGGGKSSSKQYVDKAQAPYLDFMRNAAQGIAAGQDLSGLFGLGGSLQDQGQGFLSTLGGNKFLGSLGQQARYDQGRVDQNIDQLGADLGRQFNQQVMPGIQSEAIGLGGGGGSRQGVAEGIAAQGFADAMQRGSTDIMNQEVQRNMQAATAGGGLAMQGAMGGLQGMGNVFNMGLNPFMAQFAPFQAMNSIVGPPTVLGKSSAWNISGGSK